MISLCDGNFRRSVWRSCYVGCSRLKQRLQSCESLVNRVKDTVRNMRSHTLAIEAKLAYRLTFKLKPWHVGRT